MTVEQYQRKKEINEIFSSIGQFRTLNQINAHFGVTPEAVRAGSGLSEEN